MRYVVLPRAEVDPRPGPGKQDEYGVSGRRRADFTLQFRG